MPVLKDFRTTKKISLPSFEGSEVEIYGSLLVGDIKGIDYKTNDLQQSVDTIPLFIKSWNFTNEAGEMLEINGENIGFLQIADIEYLSQQIMAFEAESKKKPNS